MKQLRLVINAAIARLVLRPLARRLFDNMRQRTMERARAAAASPIEALMETGLISPYLAAEMGIDPLGEETVAQSPRIRRQQVVIAAVVVAVVTASVVVVVAIVRSRRQDRAATPGSQTPAVARVAVPVAGTPGSDEVIAASIGVENDQLRSIDGIDAATAEALDGIGITSIEQIAAWSHGDVRRIADQLSLDPERIEREDWVGQARATQLVAAEVG